MTQDTEPETVKACLDEMDYREVEGQFGNTFETSIPCQLRFTDDVDQNTEQFHEALSDHGYGPLDPTPDHRTSRSYPHYEGEVASKDHFRRIKVLVFRRGVVRLFPKDDYIPDEDELTNLLDAIQIGFGAELEHDPIDQGEDNECASN